MPDRLSLMLDSMISAVDHGLSFDGVVSVPQVGLEEFGHRPGLAGRLDDGLELLRRAGAAISRALTRSRRGAKRSRRDPPVRQPSPSRPPQRDPTPSPPPPLAPTKEGRQGPVINEESPREDEDQAQPSLPFPPTESLPRKKAGSGLPRKKKSSEGPDAGQPSPEESKQVLGNVTHPAQPLTSKDPRKKMGVRDVPIFGSGLPRKKEKHPSDGPNTGQQLLEESGEQVLGNVTRPGIDQGSLTPTSGVAIIQPGLVNPERLPRIREAAQPSTSNQLPRDPRKRERTS